MTEEVKEAGPQDVWAVVEVMGHSQYAGRVSEYTGLGVPLVRVEIPAVEGQPAFEKLLGAASIFRITPCTEEAARRAAEGLLGGKPWPLTHWYNDEDSCRAYNMACAMADEVGRLRAENDKLQREVTRITKDRAKQMRAAQAAVHVVIETGAVPGVDSPCRCDECRYVAEELDYIGYLEEVAEEDRWWTREAAVQGMP